MLFNSYVFIFLFLPVSLWMFFRIGNMGHHRAAIAWLVGASLFFYGWWNPAYLGLILVSILFNYAFGVTLSNQDSGKGISKKTLLIIGIAINLGLLGYFKYANFFVDNINILFNANFNLEKIILPLAISFFTFQQIAYLVDAYRGETKEYNFLHYCLFVTFFPQLIAGPIVHHKEMLPQFAKDAIYRLNHENLAVGLTIFFFGLFKKVVIADGIAVYSTPVFDMAQAGTPVSFFLAWTGALAYTFQLYFDFSGYADMAIGVARMFGIRLPLNFNSPYKSVNIIDFWRRWHMTLSRFLRDYVYIALGGNRNGPTRRYVYLMTTMLLGGLWHGAGWNFVIWGGLHGIYLVINHGWHRLREALGHDLTKSSRWGRSLAQSITFIAVVVTWVFFRAESLDAAMNMLEGMFGLNGFVLPPSSFESFGWGLRLFLEDLGVEFNNSVLPALPDLSIFAWLLLLLLIAFLWPNTQEIMRDFNPAFGIQKPISEKTFIIWKPAARWCFIIGLIAVIALFNMSQISEFLYFQF